MSTLGVGLVLRRGQCAQHVDRQDTGGEHAHLPLYIQQRLRFYLHRKFPISSTLSKPMVILNVVCNMSPGINVLSCCYLPLNIHGDQLNMVLVPFKK